MNPRDVVSLLLVGASSAPAIARAPDAAYQRRAAAATPWRRSPRRPPEEGDPAAPRRAGRARLGRRHRLFHNQLVGGRLDGRFSPHLSLGGYLGFADLKGKDGRLHAALTYAGSSTSRAIRRRGCAFRCASRPATSPTTAPSCGAAAGLSFKVGRSVDLVTELAPMVWLTNNQTLLSLNLSLELAFRL